MLFYIITQHRSLVVQSVPQPEYTRTLAGWLIAPTKGHGGYPQTWEFFRNTLFSGGLFTALFPVGLAPDRC